MNSINTTPLGLVDHIQLTDASDAAAASGCTTVTWSKDSWELEAQNTTPRLTAV